jgi:F-type H+-transporting ATPase subunit epsilon
MPGVEGQLGILPGHVPLLTAIQPGELDLKAGSRGDELAVGGGFAEITGDRVTILTDMAVKPEDIDEHAVEKALESAKQALLEKKAGPEAAELMALIQRSTAQLNLKRKRRTQI